MTQDFISMMVGLAGIAMIVVIGKAALIQSNRLGISVFRPYRGDPWPIGVQEDDDARFSWTRRPNGPSAEQGDDDGAADSLAHAAFRPPRPEPQMPGFEEVPTTVVDVTPITRDGVHRVRH